MIRRIFGKKIKEVKLGRWDHKTSQLQEEIKSTWTNSDHCGDSICGDPQKIKELLLRNKEYSSRKFNIKNSTD